MMTRRNWMTPLLMTLGLFVLGCGKSQEPVSQPDPDAARKEISARARGVAGDEKPTVIVDIGSSQSMGLEPGEFRFPDDAGGKLVARLLAPPERLAVDSVREPKPRQAPRHVEEPAVPLPAQVVSLPRLPDRLSRAKLLPQFISSETPLATEEMTGGLPEAQVLPAGDRVRVPSTDVRVPIGLPVLAQPLSDKAPATDPTVDVSKNAVQKATMPGRTAPAPFLKLTVPDPFEHYDAVKMKPLPDETPPDLPPLRRP